VNQSRFDDYARRYPSVRMERNEGILVLTLHSDGDSLAWGAKTKGELTGMLADVGSDPETRIIVLTGAGESFIRPGFPEKPPGALDPVQWGSRNLPDGKKLLLNHLDIQVPMIAAVNGPAYLHGEMALLCDIVLASDQASFADTLHFRKGVIPGDGAHIVWPALLGLNRARHFLLSGKSIGAAEALALGLVAEILPRERLLDRALELARDLAERPPLALRLFREALLQPLKREMTADLGYGLALEGLAAAAYWPF